MDSRFEYIVFEKDSNNKGGMMAGNKIGGKQASITNKERHGDDFYVRIGRIGGRSGTGHAFAHGRVSPSEAGKLGGAVSKRGPWTQEQRESARRARAHKDFQEGFNEERSNWFQAMARRIK